MTGQAPQCATDLLWWALLGTLAVLSGLVSLLLKKGIIDRLDSMAESQRRFQEECHRCQEENRKEFVPREDYNQLLKIRQDVHSTLNGRINSLESGQSEIMNKLNSIDSDMTKKIDRLSRSFLVRDASLTWRIDQLATRAGVIWSATKEGELQEELMKKFGFEEGK